MDPLRIWYQETRAADFIKGLPKALRKSVKKRIGRAAAHSGSEFDLPKLAGSVDGQIRITDQPPLIFHSATTQVPEAEATLDQIFTAYRESLADDRGSWILPSRSSGWAAWAGDAGSL